MKEMNIALIGLGAIGVPVADKLYQAYTDQFYLILNGNRRKCFESKRMLINEKVFAPKLLSLSQYEKQKIDLLIVCVKNYDLASAFLDIKEVVSKDTVILPLQNGIYSFQFFKEKFQDNVVLEGYIQGPNTMKENGNFYYQNSGILHIGSSSQATVGKAEWTYRVLKDANVKVVLEKDIRHMVWKKWMLNIAGNSITALTGADYSMFKFFQDLQKICIDVMEEFLRIAKEENVAMTRDDIQDIIEYFVSYNGDKKTSMLMDVIHERKTENDYLAGTALEIAKSHGISTPRIEMLYYLMESKERVYMEKGGCITMKYLFREGVEYSAELKAAMQDIQNKMEDKIFAESVNTGTVKGLKDVLEYAVDHTKFYSSIKKDGMTIHDFPVMNKTLLNAHYDEIIADGYDENNTHKMHTSGSTGIPFTVMQDLAKRERHIADLKYFGVMAGYLDKDPMCYLRAKPTATPEQQERDHIWQLDICNLNKKNLADYYHVMVEKKCKALIAYPSTLETAVDFWSQHFVNDSCISTIISTSETLTDEIKNKLHNFFGKNTDIYARYSNTEQGILGQEAGESNVFKLNWASYYFEILKMDSDEPAEDGELGRIVITDLYNKAFPMIRYDTGDVARMRRSGKSELPELCDLFGRRMDLIYDTKGEVVSPFLLCRTMRLSKGIEQWQFIQEDTKEYTLKITANNDKKPNLYKEVSNFKKTLGEDAAIHVIYVENIPVMNSLKRKMIVSNLKK